MIPMIYIIILLAWLLLIGGFKLNDYWILCFASLMLMALGSYIIFVGLPSLDRGNLATLSFAFVHFGVGAYVMARGGIEITKDAF